MVNTYHRCIANSTISGKQCTIALYVDDNKVLHVDNNVNTRIIEVIAEHSGELTILRGGKHKFQVIDIYF